MFVCVVALASCGASTREALSLVGVVQEAYNLLGSASSLFSLDLLPASALSNGVGG